jgi:hypothetical protein
MSNYGHPKNYIMRELFLVTSIFALAVGPFQVRGAGKPKPPTPKVYQPLIIDQLNPQIVGKGFSVYDGRLIQIKRVGEQTIGGKTVGKYEDTWASESCGPIGFGIGDADNDGYKEIIATVSVYSGQRVKKDKLYDWKIVGFRDGSKGEPSWETDYFYRNTGRGGPLGIADVNGDGLNEIFIYLDTHLEIIQLNAFHDVIKLGTSPIYRTAPIASLGAGDADNQGVNEILFSIWDYSGIPRILKYDGGSWVEETNIEALPVSAIDVVKAKDADNIPGNEIISGGNNSRLMIWKYVDEYGYRFYKNVFNSDVLPNFTQGVDAADVDEFPGNEIVVGVSFNGFFIFKYDLDQYGGYYQSQFFPTGVEPINRLELEDFDNDSKSEIVAGMGNFKIFDLEDGVLIKSFEFPYARYFAIE